MKRYIYICIIIVVSIIISSILYYKQNNEIIKTIAIPSTGKIIVIDAGHGMPDEGAIGFEGITEQKINLEIALKLQKLFESSGSIVKLTRSNDNGIYSSDSNSIRTKKISDIKNRVQIINEKSNDILVSIHLNKFANPIYNGWQVFYKYNSLESEVLAHNIQKSINSNININNDRKIKSIKGIYIMDKSIIPSVIVECGFISNPKEAKLLQNKEYQNKLAWGIYLGVQEYFKE